MINKLLPKLVMILLSSSTLAISSAAGIKIAKSFNTPPAQVAGISVESIPTPTGITLTPNQRIFSSPKPSPSPKPTPKPTVKPNNLAVVPTQSCTQPPQNLCLITLFGQQFDVTSLRSSHSGGDIFACGTDMTTTYQNQHGSSLARMQTYIYHPASCTSTVNPSATPQPTSSPTSNTELRKFDDQDVDDEEHDEIKQVEDQEHEVQEVESDH